MRWSNWAGDQVCMPASIVRPVDEMEIVEAVRRAAHQGHRLRVAGSGHSFSEIALTDGDLLSLRSMRGVRAVDRERLTVTVEAGATLQELSLELARHGLSLHNLGDIDVQTVAGALATGTHGTGAELGTLSSAVVAMRIVDGGGRILDLDATSDPEAILAARVGLGALGVVVTATLRCRPLPTLERVDEPRPLDATLDSFDELSTTHQRFEFFAFPYSPVALTRTVTETDAPPAPPPRLRRWLEDDLLENHLFGLTTGIGRRWPGAVPAINRLSGRVAGRNRRVDHLHNVLPTRREVRFTEMEYAIPRTAAAVAVRAVLESVHRQHRPVGFPVEVRSVAADDALLSPAYGRPTCTISVHMTAGVDHTDYFADVAAIMAEHGGRPHWGKRHRETAAQLAPLYPEWQRFLAVRERFDPEHRFSNAYLDRVLGVGMAVAAQRKVRPSPR